MDLFVPKFQVTFNHVSHVILLPPALHHSMIADFQAMFSTHFLGRCHEENTAKVYGKLKDTNHCKLITRIKNNQKNKRTTKNYFLYTVDAILHYWQALKKKTPPTPLKINMEHNHGGLEDHFPF